MEINPFLRGLAVGFAIAAPVGPVGLLCIQRTLQQGRRYGFASGLGAATADAFYGLVAALGLTMIAGMLVAQQRWFSLAGGIFLLVLGARIFVSAPPDRSSAEVTGSLAGAYLTTLLFTLTNPVTILTFVTVFAGLGLAEVERGYMAAALLVAGVFCGSTLWWFLLSGAFSWLRDRINQRALKWVNRLAGIILTVFGLLALARLYFL